MKKKILIAVFLTSCALIFGGIIMTGWMNTWMGLSVPAMYPPFADLRTVQGAIFSVANGFDPQINNPGDPWGRAMNYPAIWIFLANIFSLNLENNYLIFICIYILAYLSICLLLLYRYSSIWILLAIFSGSSLLAVERGNNDLLVFSLIYVSSLIPLFLSGLLIASASVLKIYPIFSVVSLYGNKKLLLITSLFVGIYFLTQIPEFLKIRNGTPTSISLSYGIPSITEAINHKLKIGLNAWIVALSLILSAFLTGLSSRVKFLTVVNFESDNRYRLFLIGASIFMGTFIISSNWDYRLIFLIFCIPFIEKATKKTFKFPILILILLASNQVLLTTIFGTIFGIILCSLSKCLIFVGLFWIIQHTYENVIITRQIKI